MLCRRDDDWRGILPENPSVFRRKTPKAIRGKERLDGLVSISQAGNRNFMFGILFLIKQDRVDIVDGEENAADDRHGVEKKRGLREFVVEDRQDRQVEEERGQHGGRDPVRGRVDLFHKGDHEIADRRRKKRPEDDPKDGKRVQAEIVLPHAFPADVTEQRGHDDVR